VILLLQHLFTYVPVMNSVVYTVQISRASWAAVIAVAAVEIEKRTGRVRA
jgi:hypothetical protein